MSRNKLESWTTILFLRHLPQLSHSHSTEELWFIRANFVVFYLSKKFTSTLLYARIKYCVIILRRVFICDVMMTNLNKINKYLLFETHVFLTKSRTREKRISLYVHAC